MEFDKDYITCLCAAKITFMKFIYCRAQSSAALMTCLVNISISYLMQKHHVC